MPHSKAHKIDAWNGCYPSYWNGKIVTEAMSHPAKFSSRLIGKIYDHIVSEGWATSGDILTVDGIMLEYILCHANNGDVSIAENSLTIQDVSNAQVSTSPKKRLRKDRKQIASSVERNSLSHRPNRNSIVAKNVGITEMGLLKNELALHAEKSFQSEAEGASIVRLNATEKPSLETKEKKENTERENTNPGIQEFQVRRIGSGEAESISNTTVLSGKELAENLEKKLENVKYAEQPNTSKFTIKSHTDIAGAMKERTLQFYVLPVTEKLMSLLIERCPSFSQNGKRAWLKNSNEITFFGLSDLQVGDQLEIQASKIIDPFGGVALGALDAMRLGLNWQGIELEKKFFDIGNQNIDLWNTKMGHFSRWGTAKLHLGDSRFLLNILNDAVEVAVSSPPYADSVNSKENGIDWTKVKEDYKGRKMHAARIKSHDEYHKGYHYGETPGQLGAMPAQGFEIAISSPPFLQSDGGATLPSYYKDDPTFMARHAAGNRSSHAYGESEGQLSSMKDGGFDVAVSSPPFENQEGSMNAKKFKDPEKTAEELSNKLRDGTFKGGNYASKEAILRGLVKANESSYGDTEGNLGNDSGNDFWLASRAIVEQVYLSLVGGGHAVWVVKDYVKNKQVVPFCDQWRMLCEAVGFKTLHEHHATLIRNVKKQYNLQNELITTQSESKSFFRRVYEKKGGHRIDYETVLCMEKP